jgi:hypothetical protein
MPREHSGISHTRADVEAEIGVHAINTVNVIHPIVVTEGFGDP